MRRKPFRRSPRSSRLNSRRSKDPGLSILLALIFVPFVCHTQETALNIQQRPGELVVSASLDSPPVSELLASLDDGLEAEIRFQFRLYQRLKGLASLLGDRLLAQSEVAMTARRNFFDNSYLIVTGEGEREELSGRQDFLEKFFRTRNTFPFPLRHAPGTSYYVMARIHVTDVKLVPPLNIIYLFRPIGLTTGWERMELPEGDDEP